tara:strand:- start:265 stop:411 length:147 start_codon:yes stop_codon:yes gene_type:complete
VVEGVPGLLDFSGILVDMEGEEALSVMVVPRGYSSAMKNDGPGEPEPS